MSAKHKASAPHQPQNKPASAKRNPTLAVLVVASIAVVIAGILLLKERQEPAVTLAAAQVSAPAAAAAGSAAVAGPVKPGLPADQLSQALTAGQPVLVFMHSTTCQSCIDMMGVVDQVYPEFAAQIALVDVDIYDEANEPLIQALSLRYIPTIVVYDRAGKAAQNVGAMKADAFRTFLRQRALGG